MSKEAMAIIQYMVHELSSLKYGYREVVIGCYAAAIYQGFPKPQESRDEIVNKVIEILRGN